MPVNLEQILNEFLEKIKKTPYFDNIEFIFFYGSRLSDYHLDESDIDICISMSNVKTNLNRIRLDILSQVSEIFDVQIFQLLPLYIQNEVIKGRLIYVKNTSFLYKIVYDTIEEFEEFHPFYIDYIER